jgi:hypothetical protein
MGFGRFRGEAFNSWPVIMLIMDYLSKLAKEADIISDPIACKHKLLETILKQMS